MGRHCWCCSSDSSAGTALLNVIMGVLHDKLFSGETSLQAILLFLLRDSEVFPGKKSDKSQTVRLFSSKKLLLEDFVENRRGYKLVFY